MASAPTSPAIAVLPSHERLLRAFLEDQVGPAAGISLAVHAEDDMLTYIVRHQGIGLDQGLIEYFRSGLMAADTFLDLLRWRFGDDLGDLKVLDFASGYGRVTRFLLRELSANHLWVSDILPDSGEFQSRHLGVRAFTSSAHPGDLRVKERFDAILVASLFTHLPRPVFVPWLRTLLDLLNPGGLLLFSVHDEAVLEPAFVLSEEGFAFREFSEVHGLDAREYGTTWVSEAFVRRALAEACPETVALRRLPKGLWHFQDLYAASRRAGESFDSLPLHRGPEGFVEAAAATPERLRLSGWAADPSTRQPVEIQVLVEGRGVGRCHPSEERPGVAAHYGDPHMGRSGWQLTCEAPEGGFRPSDLLLIKARSRAGRELVIYLGDYGRLEGFLAEQARRWGAPPASEPDPPTGPQPPAVPPAQGHRGLGHRLLAWLGRAP